MSTVPLNQTSPSATDATEAQKPDPVKRTRRRRIWIAIVFALVMSAWLGRQYVVGAYDVLMISSRYDEWPIDETPTDPVVAAFVAHPDDECFLFAGTLSRLIHERNANVTLVSLVTDRAEEFRRAAERLGAVGVEILPPIEPTTGMHRPALDVEVDRILNKLDPDIVLTFGPEGITGHPDHQAVALSVWRSVHRRGKGTFLRAVLPGEFNAFVTKYAHVIEPGWGIWPIHRVPLGRTGAIRSAIADGYVIQREVLARDEWKANLINTEFFAVTRLDRPANERTLYDSAEEPVITAAEALLVVHPTAGWDLRYQTKPAVDRLVERFDREGNPIAILTNEWYPFIYLSSRTAGRGYASAGGEHNLRFAVDRIWLAGGSYGSCLDRGVRCAIAGAIETGSTRLELAVPPEAIYSITYWDDRTGAVTLRERMDRDPAAPHQLVDAFVASVTDNTPLGDYLNETEIPDLPTLLAGWRISVRFPDEKERLFAEGAGNGHLIFSVR